MLIGEWTVDDAGMMQHLKCNQPAPSWGNYHQCWVGTGRIATTGHEEGRYEPMPIPEMVLLISRLQYEIWVSSREPYRGKT